MPLPDVSTCHFVVPSVPRVVALLLLELGQPKVDLRRLAQLIAQDPALCLAVLKAANAPELGLPARVLGVGPALVVLRLDQVRALARHAAASAGFRALPGVAMPQLWACSLDAARVARALAGLLQLDTQAAYALGLVHAVGEIALREADPRALQIDLEAPPFTLRRAKAEQRVLGYCATELLAHLARHWHLPAAWVDALAWAHEPFENEAYEPLAGVLHLAMWRAGARQSKLRGNALTVTFPSLVAEVLGLDIDLVLQQDPIDWMRQAPI